jgi:hypothetical protein
MRLHRRSVLIPVLLTLCVVSAAAVEGQLSRRDALPDRRLVAHANKLEDLVAVSPLDLSIAKSFDLPGSRLHPGHNEPSSSVGPGLLGEPRGGDLRADPSITREELLGFVCRLDALVVATPTAVHVIANTSRTAFVTVFELRVSQWIRPTLGPPTVALPYFGGQAVIAGERYQVDYPTQQTLPRLDVRGIAYLTRERPHSFYRVDGGAMVQEVDGRVTLEGLRQLLASAVAELTSVATSCKDSAR